MSEKTSLPACQPGRDVAGNLWVLVLAPIQREQRLMTRRAEMFTCNWSTAGGNSL